MGVVAVGVVVVVHPWAALEGNLLKAVWERREWVEGDWGARFL